MTASTVVETGGEVALIDPLAPPEDREVGNAWTRRRQRSSSSSSRTTSATSTSSCAATARGAFRPSLFWRDDIPETELDVIEPGSELPGGLVALYDGRGRNETPLWAPEQRALLFADALTERTATPGLGPPWHDERTLPALRALLDLPFQHVIVSHGEPVHDRAAFERALELPPYEGKTKCRFPGPSS